MCNEAYSPCFRIFIRGWKKANVNFGKDTFFVAKDICFIHHVNIILCLGPLESSGFETIQVVLTILNIARVVGNFRGLFAVSYVFPARQPTTDNESRTQSPALQSPTPSAEPEHFDAFHFLGHESESVVLEWWQEWLSKKTVITPPFWPRRDSSNRTLNSTCLSTQLGPQMEGKCLQTLSHSPRPPRPSPLPDTPVQPPPLTLP